MSLTDKQVVLENMLRQTILENPYIPKRPHPTTGLSGPTLPQAKFLLLPNKEALYGGAAGGGKSDALLMGALQFVGVPEYSALVLRRTYADLALPGAIMERSQTWLRGTGARWVDKDKTWHFPSGATMTFGYLQSENDKYRYQGSEFHFIGFDELTQFTYTQYTYLMSRLRRLQGSVLPVRVRSASNPGGSGHEWVRQRFLVEAGRPFVPARLTDNPYVDIEEYTEMLMELDPLTRKQLLNGDWTARAEGNMFQREWFEIVSPHEVPEQAKKRTVRYWDLAATEKTKSNEPDWTAGCKMSEYDGVFYIWDMQHFRKSPQQTDEHVGRTADQDGRLTVTIWIEQEPGSSGKRDIDNWKRRVLKGYIVRGNKVTGSKVLRARPLSAAAEAGNVKLVRGAWIGAFLDEAEGFPEIGHDDQVDAASGAFDKLVKRPGQQAVAG